MGDVLQVDLRAGKPPEGANIQAPPALDDNQKALEGVFNANASPDTLEYWWVTIQDTINLNLYEAVVITPESRLPINTFMNQINDGQGELRSPSEQQWFDSPWIFQVLPGQVDPFTKMLQDLGLNPQPPDPDPDDAGDLPQEDTPVDFALWRPFEFNPVVRHWGLLGGFAVRFVQYTSLDNFGGRVYPHYYRLVSFSLMTEEQYDNVSEYLNQEIIMQGRPEIFRTIESPP